MMYVAEDALAMVRRAVVAPAAMVLGCARGLLAALIDSSDRMHTLAAVS